MTIKTHVKAGGVAWNHNQALTICSGIKAGGASWNHNEALAVLAARGLLRRLLEEV